MTRAIAQHAKQLCELGIEIAKLKYGSKEPAGIGWQNRIAENPSTIDRWKGEYNIGAMGGSHGPNGKRLLIVDIDVKNGAPGQENFERLLADYGRLPKTAEALTPSGGRHYYLWGPPTMPMVGIREQLKQRGYKGIDVLGANLFAVAAPSVLQSGGRYEWCRKPWDGIADAPDWLVALFGPPPAAESNGSETKAIVGHVQPDPAHLEEVIRRYPVHQPGQRNARTCSATLCLFNKGLGPAGVLAIMQDWLQHYSACIGTAMPAAEYHLRATIKSCFSQIEQGRLTIGGTADHLQDSCALQLPPAALQFLSSLQQGGLGIGSCVSLLKGRQTASLSLLPAQPTAKIQPIRGEELQMAEALARHCIYEQGRHPERQEIHMTDRQLKAIMEQKFGTRFDDNGNGNSIKLRRLKYKFVTTEKGKAGKVELLVRIVNGHTSVPSVYRVTGIAPALVRA